jgi:uracil-DNA glycosylase
MTLAGLLTEIRGCTVCAASLPLGPRPIVQAAPHARLLIIGQAPGKRVHESGIPWDDASGERLREWTALPPECFYDPAQIAMMPMGFCYPGVAISGGDAPPRRECAPLWHARLRAALPAVRLTLLVGSFAQKAYLSKTVSLTDAVRNFAALPYQIFLVPHPSWRSTSWMRRNPWFEADVLPVLKARVSAALA